MDSSPGVADDARKRLLPDLTPWRESPGFRRLWWSGGISGLGSVFALVALPLQIKELTGSPFAVGAIGIAELVPTVVFALYGGALADAVDRRKMALGTELALGALSLLLLGNSMLDRPMLWPLYAVAACVAALQGLQQPSMEAMLPRLVHPDQLTAAIALSSMRMTAAVLIGPAAAGFVVAGAGIPVSYVIDVASFAISALFLAGIPPLPPAGDVDKPSLRGIGEGIRYALRRRELLGSYCTDLAATLLALPIALYPFLADELHARWALGLLYSATGVGGLIASVTSGWASRVHHHGRLVLLGSVVLGACMIGVGFAHRLWLVLLLLVIGGMGHFVGDLFRGTLWNQSVPDRLRGRLAGIELLIGASGPQLGDIRAGSVGAGFGVRVSIWTGGVLCVAVAGTLAATLPSLWRYDARTDPHVAARRAES
ncbi:MFS transporter [Amycolatopsis minnesotensis]|uniref:MFS transporter n=1 Tax=Amycolatopsis minnesotensis TaxID=337894 RepID=A0ABN2SEW4_9PSEU